MTEKKIAELQRQVTAASPNGTFGFSVLGGAGTKFPAVVCEVDSGGPADMSGKVRIGDRLRGLNGEDLKDLTPNELVQSIRSAPSPSTFILEEDETLREQVMILLKKQEKREHERHQRAAASSTSSPAHSRKKHNIPPTKDEVYADKKKGKKDRKVIEVEPSVNLSGGGGHIFKVLDNRIIGQVDSPSDGERRGEGESVGSGRRVGHSPRPRRAKGSPSPHKDGGSSIPEENGRLKPPNSLQPQLGPGYPGSLERKPHPTTHSPNVPTKSMSMDSFSQHVNNTPSPNLSSTATSTSTGKMTDSKNLNGVGGGSRSPSGSSGNNCFDVGGSHSSLEEKERERARAALDGVRENDTGREEEIGGGGGDGAGGDGAGGGAEEEVEVQVVSIKIPDYPSQLAVVDRTQPNLSCHGSVSDNVLVRVAERESVENSESVAMEGERENEIGEVAEKPPVSPKWLDPAEKEKLIQKYRMAPKRSSSKKQIDPASKAVTLARKLYMLDGFKKSQVAERLADPSEFGQAVAREYLSLFDFHDVNLEAALRQFLTYFSLTGESQERERVMQHFSDRYHHCNPETLPSTDAVHGLCIAILLLNTDLHTPHGGRKMSMAQFSDNLTQIEVSISKEMLKTIYNNIKRHPLEWAMDDDTLAQVESGVQEEGEDDDDERVYHVTIPGTFVQVELPGSAPVFKEGFIMKKNIMEAPHKKVPRGKRQWKAYYAYLKGFLLYFAPPQGQGELHLDDTSSAITITHCLAMRAHDYQKKSSVVRVTTADWHVFLLEATNVTDMQQWIGAINKAASLYSSPPLAAPVASRSGFQRPTFPLAPTRNGQDQQEESHDVKIRALDKELKDHQQRKPTGKSAKHGQLEEWFDQYEFVQYEINRFRIYLGSLSSDVIVDYNAPLPSGLIPSPSISTLHNPNEASGEVDFLENFHRHSSRHQPHAVGTPPSSLRAGSHIGAVDPNLLSHSPLLARQQYHK